MRTPIRARLDLLTVRATALVARLLVSIVATAVHGAPYFLPTDDSYEYLRLGESLAAGSFSQDGVAEVLRTPGYPLLVALGAVTGHPIGLTILLQVAIGGVGAAIVYALAHQMATALGRWIEGTPWQVQPSPPGDDAACDYPNSAIDSTNRTRSTCREGSFLVDPLQVPVAGAFREIRGRGHVTHALAVGQPDRHSAR